MREFTVEQIKQAEETIRLFEREAIRYQKLSRSEEPEVARLNGLIARKYLFHIIDLKSDILAFQSKKRKKK